MGFVVKLFFLIILASILLSFALGWVAVLRARAHLMRSFGFIKKPTQESGKVIEGEYRVLSEDEERKG